MPRTLLISLAVLLTTVPAAAQLTPEIQVSTPVYGAAPGDQYAPVVATNGSEFLVAWPDGRGNPGSTYANRVTRDGRVLDGTGIRVGWYAGLLGAFFMNGAYTLLYSSSLDVGIVRISEDGRVIDGPRSVFTGFVRAAAANASRIILAGEDETIAVNAEGDVVTRNPMPSAYGVNVASNGSTFLVSTFTYNGVNSVYFIALDANGKQTDITRIDASASGDGPLIGSDGTDFVVIYNDGRRGAPIAQLVSPHAEIRSATISGNYNALTWTGQSYLATSTAAPDQQIVLTRVDPTGKPMSGSQVLGSGTPGVVNQPSIVWNGREALLAWTSGLQQDPEGFNVVAALANREGALTSAVTAIPSSSNMQVNPAIATSGPEDLVVWAEMGGVYATRVTISGVPLDGRGFVVSNGGTASREVTIGNIQTLHAIYDGTAYIVAWGGYDGIKAQRIDAASGALVGPAVYLSGCSGSFDLVAGPDSPVLFVAPCSDLRVFAQRVGINGIIGAGVPISPDDILADQPRAAWNGSEWLVTWMKLIELPLLISPPLYRGNVYAARMSRDLTLLDTQPLPIAVGDFAESGPLVASDGRDFVIAWSHESWNQESGVYVRRVGNNGSIGDASPVALGRSAPTSLVWNGKRYALAFARNGDLFLTHLSGDEVPVSATSTEERYASLLSAPGRPLRIVYTRVAPEPEYGGVARVFMRDESAMRRRSVRPR